MPELTERAAANLAAGGKTGPGTDVCRNCTGPKEPSRLNSVMCKACARPGATASTDAAPVSGNPDALAAITARLDKQATAIKQLRTSRDELRARVTALEARTQT